MDRKKMFANNSSSNCNNNNNRTSRFNNDTCSAKNRVAAAKSKSIETQTEESSFLLNSPSYHRRLFDGLTNDEMTQSLYQNALWKPDCGPGLCPGCNHTSSFVHAGYSQSNNPLLPCAMPPWFTPYNSCVAPFGFPPFIHMPMFHHGLLSYGNVANVVQGLDSVPSKTNSNKGSSNFCGDSVIGEVEKENLNKQSAFVHTSRYRPNDEFKHKLKTSPIRSEPNVAENNSDHSYSDYNTNNSSSSVFKKNTENKIKCDENLITNLLCKNVLKKNYFKSDTDILVVTNSKIKTNNNLNNNYSNKDNSILNQFDVKNTHDFKFDNRGDFSSKVCNSDKEFFKSPIYKYADIRIHELSSSLKNIKDNLYKLSTKASELNASEPNCDSDDNFNKYFKSVYTEFNGGDIVEECEEKIVDRDSSFNNSDRSNLELNWIQQLDNNLDVNESPSASNLLLQRKQVNELFTSQHSSSKSTVPLHDIPSVLNYRYEISSQDVPVKMKTVFYDGKNEIKTKNRNGGRNTIPFVDSNSLSNFNNIKNNRSGKKSQNSLMVDNLNENKSNSLGRKPYDNNLFKINLNSFTEKDFIEIDCNKLKSKVDKVRPTVDNDQVSNKGKGKILNEQQSLSSVFRAHPEGFTNYKEMVCDNNHNSDNNDDEDDDDDNVDEYIIDDHEEYEEGDSDCDNLQGTCVDHSHRTLKDQLLSPAVRSEQNSVNVENWLEKNVASSEHDSNNTYQNPCSLKQPQFTSSNNLEFLSKISEEDEDKFSSVSAGSDQPKHISLVRDRLRQKNDNSNRGRSNNVTDLRKLASLNTLRFVENSHCHDNSGKKDSDGVVKKNCYLEEKCGTTWIH